MENTASDALHKASIPLSSNFGLLDMKYFPAKIRIM